jgi:hypothetical protein
MTWRFSIPGAAIALAVTMLATGLMAATADATFVLKNGERHSGRLVYHQSADVNLVIGGEERSFPIDDIALITFDGTEPTKEEIDSLPTDAVPVELDRHTLVLRSGERLRGKFYDFRNERVEFHSRSGSGGINRRDFALGDVRRLYFSAPSSRSLFANAPSEAPATTPLPAGLTVRVAGNQQWTDTQLNVRSGERIAFMTSGTVTVLAGGAEAGPDGLADVARGRTLPVRAMAVGGLIARVGNSAPFPIGGNTAPVRMPASGRLQLGINDTEFVDNGGHFDVAIRR